MVYVLACGKDYGTYHKIFSKLKEAEPMLKPKTVMVDFEQAAIKAVKNVFPESDVFGCFFHLCQSIYRHIQGNGLQSIYATDATFAQYMRCLAALAFVPPEHVYDHFQSLKKMEFFQTKLNGQLAVDLGIQNLLQYVEKTWIGHYHRNRFVAPLFPINLWNMYHLTLHGFPRTNNSVEAWHNAIMGFFGIYHPNIFKFIDGIKKEQDSVEIIVAKMMAGIDTENKNKKQAELSERLIKVVKTYEDQEKFQLKDYLFGVSSAVSYPLSKK